MASISVSNQSSPYSGRGLCRIVGFACLAGFLLDILVLALPFNASSLEWRIGMAQQVGDRSIVLLFGAALTMFGSFDNRRWLKRFALFCLIIGIVFQLSCVLVIRDSLTLQQQALKTINTQAGQLQSQIEKAKNSTTTAQPVTPEQVQKASQLVSTQAESLKQNAKTVTFKTGFSSLANLIVVGVALISLGRYGLRLRRG